jgi:hypothetical protein
MGAIRDVQSGRSDPTASAHRRTVTDFHPIWQFALTAIGTAVRFQSE